MNRPALNRVAHAFACRDVVMQSKRTVMMTVVGALVVGLMCGASDPPPAFTPVRVWEANAAELEVCLGQQQALLPDPARRLALWAAASVGQPHAEHGPADERREAEGGAIAIGVSRCDGRKFVEQACALALARDRASAGTILQLIRYRDGVVSLETRNYHLLGDWARNNAWVFEDVTRQLAGGMAWIPSHRVLRRAEYLRSRHGLNVTVPDEKVLDAFVPRVYLYKVLDELRDGDLAVFIAGNDREQRGADVGIIRRDADGDLTLVHAAPPAVSEEPLMGESSFTARHKEIIGYKFLRLRSDASERARARCQRLATADTAEPPKPRE